MTSVRRILDQMDSERARSLRQHAAGGHRHLWSYACPACRRFSAPPSVTTVAEGGPERIVDRSETPDLDVGSSPCPPSVRRPSPS